MWFRMSQITNQVAQDVLSNSLGLFKSILNTRLESRYRTIIEIAHNVSHDATVFPLIYAGDETGLKDRFYELAKSLQVDVIMCTDHEGKILARSDKEDATGVVVKGKSHLFDRALQGSSEKGIFRRQDELLQIVAIPVFDNAAKDVVRGTLAIAKLISADISEEIHKLTQSHIGFFTYPKVSQEKQASTPPISHSVTSEASLSGLNTHIESISQANLESYIHKNEKGDFFKILLGGKPYFAVFEPLLRSDGNREGFVVAFKSEEALLAPFNLLYASLKHISMVVFVIALLLAYGLSRHISSPIYLLVDWARKIRQGQLINDKDVRFRRDEIGELQEAFKLMNQAMVEKEELEAFLAIAATPESPEKELQEFVSEEITDQGEMMNTVSLHQSPPASSHSFPPGTVVGSRYMVLKELGKGGMGMVVLCQDRSLDETIAVKIMRKDGVPPEEWERIKDEIRLARKITHKNILRTFDFGVDETHCFITMEYVGGISLSQMIERQKGFPVKMGVILAKQLCGAMITAHDEGVIHRDLKPHNMIINRQGVLKVMDFGLAMQVKVPVNLKDGDLDQKINTARTNNSGIVAGTPAYMAPEQFQGLPLDVRTDIYAMGVVLFQLFSGKLPFSGKNVRDLAYKHIKETPPDLKQMIPGFSDEMCGIIYRCMEKDPLLRYQSVREILTALETIKLK